MKTTNKEKATQRIKQLLLQAEEIAETELGVKNIFYNEAYMELFLADELGHEWNSETQGGDAFESNGTPTEYKSINTRSKGKGSFQFHWLSDKKLEKYSATENMYFAFRDGVTINEIYALPTSKLIKKLTRSSTGGKSIHGHTSLSRKNLEALGAKKIK